MMRQFLMLFALSVVIVGCGVLPPLDPIASEKRTVSSAVDAAKTISVTDGMVWYNANRTRGLRFPPGIYALEAEDDGYWYFRSKSPLEFKSFNGGSVIDSQSISGGIMLSKSRLSAVPAGGYIDSDGPNKTQVWKLGGEFISREGRDWKKSF